jgi:hypothetical protein
VSLAARKFLDIPRVEAYLSCQFGELKDEAFLSFSSEGVLVADFPRETVCPAHSRSAVRGRFAPSAVASWVKCLKTRDRTS